jgi:hypothetical protein
MPSLINRCPISGGFLSLQANYLSEMIGIDVAVKNRSHIPEVK